MILLKVFNTKSSELHKLHNTFFLCTFMTLSNNFLLNDLDRKRYNSESNIKLMVSGNKVQRKIFGTTQKWYLQE